MRSKSRALRRQPAAGLTDRWNILGLPILFILCAFAVSASSGEEILDRGILPLVRFLSLLALASAIFSVFVVSQRCVYSRKRWIVGQVAAVCMAYGAGHLWTATAYGSGFTFYMVGVLLIVMLIVKEIEARSEPW